MKDASRPRRSRAEMFPLMERYERDNQSQADFCRAQDLSMSVFQYWWRRYRQAQNQEEKVEAPDFVPIELSTASSYAMEILYPDGTRLRFNRVMPAAYLEPLLLWS